MVVSPQPLSCPKKGVSVCEAKDSNRNPSFKFHISNFTSPIAPGFQGPDWHPSI